MTQRPILASDRITPAALEQIGVFGRDVLRRVRDAVAAHDVVVVGMAQNPHVRKVRAALAEAGIPFEYLEFGSYLSGWRTRLAIKLWSGWPTYPQVFVKGHLIGGENLTKAAIADGSLRARLDGEPASAEDT
jgi:monothiol glutaredoxin